MFFFAAHMLSGDNFTPQSKQEDMIRMDVYMDTIRNNDQWKPPLFLEWTKSGLDQILPIYMFAFLIWFAFILIICVPVNIATLYLDCCWTTFKMAICCIFCVSCRQQKEEDEELERILQLSLTEK